MLSKPTYHGVLADNHAYHALLLPNTVITIQNASYFNQFQ